MHTPSARSGLCPFRPLHRPFGNKTPTALCEKESEDALSDRIHCLRLWAASGMRHIRERVRAHPGSPRRPLPLAAFPAPPAYARESVHVAACMRPIDGNALGLVRPYLRTRKEVTHV